MNREEKLLPAAPFTHDWMKQKHEETLSSLSSLRWKRGTFLTCPTHLTCSVIPVFPVHAHPSLMTLWSRLHNDPQRPGLITGTCWDLAPYLDYEWSPVRGPGTLRLAPIHIQVLLDLLQKHLTGEKTRPLSVRQLSTFGLMSSVCKSMKIRSDHFPNTIHWLIYRLIFWESLNIKMIRLGRGYKWFGHRHHRYINTWF